MHIKMKSLQCKGRMTQHNLPGCWICTQPNQEISHDQSPLNWSLPKILLTHLCKHPFRDIALCKLLSSPSPHFYSVIWGEQWKSGLMQMPNNSLTKRYGPKKDELLDKLNSSSRLNSPGSWLKITSASFLYTLC